MKLFTKGLILAALISLFSGCIVTFESSYYLTVYNNEFIEYNAMYISKISDLDWGSNLLTVNNLTNNDSETFFLDEGDYEIYLESTGGNRYQIKPVYLYSDTTVYTSTKSEYFAP